MSISRSLYQKEEEFFIKPTSQLHITPVNTLQDQPNPAQENICLGTIYSKSWLEYAFQHVLCKKLKIEKKQKVEAKFSKKKKFSSLHLNAGWEVLFPEKYISGLNNSSGLYNSNGLLFTF